MQSTLKLPVIGLDLAKSVFQLHIFAKCIPSLVAMEACGSSQYCQHRTTFPQFRRSKFPHSVAVPVLSRM